MASTPLPFPSTVGGDWSARLRRAAPYLLLLLATLAVRAARIGDPAIDYDEQLYLLIGDGLRHGLIPYVDLWDRKPIGLFLIYAAFDGVIRYQIAAALSAGATAGLIYAMARRTTPPPGAFAAGLGYVLWLALFHGEGGQSPVFYNLLTAIAAWACLRAGGTRDHAGIVKLGLLAMAASGLALQVKYVHLPEGVFFGCWMLWRLHREGARVRSLTTAGVAMIAVALAPTLAALAVYAAIGHLDAFLFANFTSILRRGSLPAASVHFYLGYIATVSAPLVVALAAALWRQRRSPDFAFVAGWLAAALIGFAMIGTFYDNYALPLLLPAFIAVAPSFARGPIGFASALGLLAWPLALRPPDLAAARTDRAGMAALVAATAPYVSARRCLYVYDGPSELYRRSAGCRPTRFVYPDHLTNAAEAPALGVDAAAEETRILASRPGAIVTASMPLGLGFNDANRSLAGAALARDYVAVAAVRFATRTYYVHAQRDLAGTIPRIADPRASAAL